MIASRRRFLFGAGASLLAAPAIVRVAANLMPVSKVYVLPPGHTVGPVLQVGDTVMIDGRPFVIRWTTA